MIAEQVLTRLRHRLRREFVLLPLFGFGLAAVMTWPTLRHPASTLPKDLGDPVLISWILSWVGHATWTDPATLWNANAFYPEHDSLAFTDSLIGYAPFGLLGNGPTAAVLRYNLLFVFAAALAFIGAYALARALGSRWQGAAVAGAAFAYAPWRSAQAGHLQVLSTGGIALSLALLAYGHGWSLRRGYRPERVKPGWAAAGWGIASWQLALGFGIGVPFLYALLLCCLAAIAGWFLTGRPRLSRRLLVMDGIGGVAFALLGWLQARPYLRVVDAHPYARRGLGDIELFSPPPRGFLIAPDDSLLWGGAHAASRALLPFPPEMTLLPGIVLLVLALLGLFTSVWKPRQRLILSGLILVCFVLALGTRGPFGGRFTYLPLLNHLPGWDALRTPGRLVIWITLGLCLLAAGTVSSVAESRTWRLARAAPRWMPWSSRLRHGFGLALLLPAALVLFEGLTTQAHPVVPAAPAALAGVRGPLLVLPSQFGLDGLTTLWTTDHYPKLVNGTSGFTPHSQDQTRAATVSFPDPASVEYLRKLGIRTVVVLRDQLPGTPWQEAANRSITGLAVHRSEVGNDLVFTLDPA